MSPADPNSQPLRIEAVGGVIIVRDPAGAHPAKITPEAALLTAKLLIEAACDAEETAPTAGIV